MEIPKLRLEFTPPKFSTPVFESAPFSPYDTMEELNLQAQTIFSTLDKLQAEVSSKETIENLKEEILNLISGWEDAFEAKIRTSHVKTPSPRINYAKNQNEQQLIDQIAQIEDEYQLKINELEKRLKESEELKSKIHSDLQEKLKEIDHDLDEIIFHYKLKWKKVPVLGNILQDLFSPEELEEEGRIALGEERVAKEIKITKLEASRDENWDMNVDSEDSSGPPSRLEGSGLIFYNKLHDLRSKLYNFRHHDIEDGSLKLGLDEGFIESLPISMKSLSNAESLKFTNLLTGLKSRDSSLLIEPKYGKTCGDVNKPIYENTSEVTPQAGIVFNGKAVQNIFPENILSVEEQERFVMTLIENEVPEGNDVCLDDLLDISRSDQGFPEKPSPIGNTDQSVDETSLGSFLQASYVKNDINDTLNLSGTLTFKNRDEEKIEVIKKESVLELSELLQEKSFSEKNASEEINLSGIQSDFSSNNNFLEINNHQNLIKKELNISNESSIPFIQDSSVSYLSDNSGTSHERGSKKKFKKKNLLHRPKLDDKEEDSMSSIFPPLSMDSSKAEKKRPRLPVIAMKPPPTEPPKHRYLNLRGRSLQPIASPKSIVPAPFLDPKFLSPSPVSKFRIQRYKDLGRPFQHIDLPFGFVPQEPK
ncbi:unnamed protein product [Blepharisma stoltei]|uniref:Uncharacterized protein n=1 Tax=Blepharisma stoltei TaxID=1481888 RepID=A0AAU9K951_9CILI|nr:unnamed protein product [Blepharisma stoltei]